MHQRISKKFLFYLFILAFLGTVNNIDVNRFNFPKIKDIKISGLEGDNNSYLLENIKNLDLGNIFFLNDIEIQNMINSNNLIEKYNIFKKYPSSLNVKIDKTKFLARITNKDGIYLLGSNGKLTKDNFNNDFLPFIDGSPSISEFLKFKKIIDNSKFEYQNIKNLFFFPSKRWDIETNNEIVIKLPKDETEQVLNLIYQMIFNQNFKDIKIIDARIKNQIIIDD